MGSPNAFNFGINSIIVITSTCAVGIMLFKHSICGINIVDFVI